MTRQSARLRDYAPRAVAEFVVIVTGVLVALAADDWRQEVQDRRDEAAYLGRIISDLEWDAEQLEQAARGFLGKREPLDRLIQVAVGNRTASGEEIAVDLINGSRWAWAMADARQSTFDEMRTSGRLGLIRDPAVRASIIDYYADSAIRRASIEARRSEMGELVYELVRHQSPEGGERRAPPSQTAAGLTAVELEVLTDPSVLDEVRRAATAEWNFSLWGLADIEWLLGETESLIAALRQYSGPAGRPPA